MALSNRPEYELTLESLRIGSKASIREHIRLLMLNPRFEEIVDVEGLLFKRGELLIAKVRTILAALDKQVASLTMPRVSVDDLSKERLWVDPEDPASYFDPVYEMEYLPILGEVLEVGSPSELKQEAPYSDRYSITNYLPSTAIALEDLVGRVFQKNEPPKKRKIFDYQLFAE